MEEEDGGRPYLGRCSILEVGVSGNLLPVDSRGVFVETNNVEEEDALNGGELKTARLAIFLGGRNHWRGGIGLVSRRQRGLGLIVALVIRHCYSALVDEFLLLE